MPRPAKGTQAMSNADRQARYRETRRQMQEALQRIRDQARSVREAREIAAAVLAELEPAVEPAR